MAAAGHFRPRIVLPVLVLGLIWRVLLCVLVVPAWESRTGIAPAPDQYPTLARSLLETGTLGYGELGANPTTVRGPAFATWLALGLVGGSDNRWLALWGSLPGLLVGAALAGLVAARGGGLAGLITGAVAVAHPLPSLIAARVMGDEFYGAIGAAALVLWALALGADRSATATGLAAGSGLLLAVQMLSRSAGLITLVVACVAGVLFLRRHQRRGLAPRLLAVLVVVALTPALVWSLRSSRLEGRPVFVHSLAAYNFWLGEGLDRHGGAAAPGRGWSEIVAFALSRADVSREEADRFWYGQLEPQEVARLEGRLAAEARRHVLEHPIAYARRVALGIPRFWYRAQSRARSVQYGLAALPVLLLAALGARGARQAWSRGDPLPTLLIVSVVLHNLAYAAIVPMARYSVGVYASLAVLAGLGIASLTTRRHGAIHGRAD